MVLVGQKPHQVKGGGRSNPDTASTVPCEANLSAPRPRLLFQPGLLDALKAPLALENQLVQDPHPRIQVRMPDTVGMPESNSKGWGIFRSAFISAANTRSP